ncbi:MAG: response regulator [Acidobacteria bacterium]|nr:response regulator [Acidobacteriota bacterium]
MAKVLVVDDDPDIVEAARFFLEKEGYEVAEANSRDDAMRQMEEFQPDLLILDVMMEQPDDGLAMAQELRRRGWKRPILMLTSLGKVTGLNYGRDDALVPVDDFQEKPVGPAELVSKVRALLQRAQG